MYAITAETPIAAWLSAVEHLHKKEDWRESRIVLEVKNPVGMSSSDREVFEILDQFLVDKGGLPVSTVANTIFPWGLYSRSGDNLYGDYLEIFPKMQKDCDARTWGTYFHRMIRRIDHKGVEINPLEYLIGKLNKRLSNRAAYELGVEDLFVDLPTYDPRLDKHHPLGGPCLSHVSFSLTAERHLDLTALYRSHFYVQRALGNLFGLAHLMQYIGNRTGLKLGTLACISNTAQLDTKKDCWGVKDISKLVKNCTAAGIRNAA